jgi:hypothetical protein
MVEQNTLSPFENTRADFSIPAPSRPLPGPTDLISFRDFYISIYKMASALAIGFGIATTAFLVSENGRCSAARD